MRRLPNNQMEFNIGLGVKAHSLDVVADIIGTMRMQKIIEITENVQPNEKERIEQLDKELHILISPACNNRSQSRKSRASSILRAAVFVPV